MEMLRLIWGIVAMSPLLLNFLEQNESMNVHNQLSTANTLAFL